MSTAHLVAPLLNGRFEDVAGEFGVGVLLCDGHGGCRTVTAHAADLLGLTEDDLASGNWRLTDDRGAPLPTSQSWSVRCCGPTPPTTTAVVVKEHRRLWLELYPVVLRGVRLAVAVVRPVHTDALRDKGLLDPVTGLPNRVLLFDRLDQALRRARARGTRVTLVLADVRGLRELAPELGDRVLRETGDRLTGGLGIDHTVARHGGGTFAVVVDHPHGPGTPVAERVAELAPYPVRIGWVTSDGADTVHDLVAARRRNCARDRRRARERVAPGPFSATRSGDRVGGEEVRQRGTRGSSDESPITGAWTPDRPGFETGSVFSEGACTTGTALTSPAPGSAGTTGITEVMSVRSPAAGITGRTAVVLVRSSVAGITGRTAVVSVRSSVAGTAGMTAVVSVRSPKTGSNSGSSTGTAGTSCRPPTPETGRLDTGSCETGRPPVTPPSMSPPSRPPPAGRSPPSTSPPTGRAGTSPTADTGHRQLRDRQLRNRQAAGDATEHVATQQTTEQVTAQQVAAEHVATDRKRRNILATADTGHRQLRNRQAAGHATEHVATQQTTEQVTAQQVAAEEAATQQVAADRSRGAAHRVRRGEDVVVDRRVDGEVRRHRVTEVDDLPVRERGHAVVDAGQHTGERTGERVGRHGPAPRRQSRRQQRRQFGRLEATVHRQVDLRLVLADLELARVERLGERLREHLDRHVVHRDVGTDRQRAVDAGQRTVLAAGGGRATDLALGVAQAGRVRVARHRGHRVAERLHDRRRRDVDQVAGDEALVARGVDVAAGLGLGLVRRRPRS